MKITKFHGDMSQMTMCVWLKLDWGSWGMPGNVFIVRYRSNENFDFAVGGVVAKQIKLFIGWNFEW